MPGVGSMGPRLTAAQQELNRTAAQYNSTPTSPLSGPPGRPSVTDTLSTHPGGGPTGDADGTGSEAENVGVAVHSAAVTVGMGVCIPCSAMFLILLTLIIGERQLEVEWQGLQEQSHGSSACCPDSLVNVCGHSNIAYACYSALCAHTALCVFLQVNPHALQCPCSR
jgi:hypothetical protein